MKAAILMLTSGLAAVLMACGQNTDPTNATGNPVAVPADQAEQELMANGFSGERSSGEPATGNANSGTTGQANVSGEAPAGATGSATQPTSGPPETSR